MDYYRVDQLRLWPTLPGLPFYFFLQILPAEPSYMFRRPANSSKYFRGTFSSVF